MLNSKSESALLRRNLELQSDGFEKSLEHALHRSKVVRENIERAKLADKRLDHALMYPRQNFLATRPAELYDNVLRLREKVAELEKEISRLKRTNRLQRSSISSLTKKAEVASQSERSMRRESELFQERLSVAFHQISSMSREEHLLRAQSLPALHSAGESDIHAPPASAARPQGHLTKLVTLQSPLQSPMANSTQSVGTQTELETMLTAPQQSSADATDGCDADEESFAPEEATTVETGPQTSAELQETLDQLRALKEENASLRQSNEKLESRAAELMLEVVSATHGLLLHQPQPDHLGRAATNTIEKAAPATHVDMPDMLHLTM